MYTHKHATCTCIQARSISLSPDRSDSLLESIHSLKANVPGPEIYNLGPVDYYNLPGKQSVNVNQYHKDD